MVGTNEKFIFYISKAATHLSSYSLGRIHCYKKTPILHRKLFKYHKLWKSAQVHVQLEIYNKVLKYIKGTMLYLHSNI